MSAFVQSRPDSQLAHPSRDIALVKLGRQVLRYLDWRALPKVREVRHVQGKQVVPRLLTVKASENGAPNSELCTLARRSRGGLLIPLLLAAGVGRRWVGWVHLSCWAGKGEHEEEDKPSAPRVTTRQPRSAPVTRPGATQGNGESRAQTCAAESHPDPCAK